MTLHPEFDITLEFLSDWHIGTGQGRLGSIDAEVRRDESGLPFVPAKTLVGVWRDACETVAATFDRGPRGPWHAWVTWLFGSQSSLIEGPSTDGVASGATMPVPAALRLTPARAPAWLRDAVRRPLSSGARHDDDPGRRWGNGRHGWTALAQAAVVLRPGVKIDDATGTAADRYLRVEERAIRGLRLSTRVSVATDAESLPFEAELLLRAGARLVEAVGGKRNRGCGRVAMLLPESRVERRGAHPVVVDPSLNALLADGVPSTSQPPPRPADQMTVYPRGRLHGQQRRTVRLIMETVTPVLAAEDVLANVIHSRDTIPGTALLGTILSRITPVDETGRGAAARPEPGQDPPVGLGDVAVGDAVPAAGDPADPASVVPSLPVPRVWRRGDKGRGGDVHNVAVESVDQAVRAKAMSGRIAAQGSNRWQAVAPAWTVSTHAVVDDAARRPTVASGGVYTYLAIPAGTLLCSDIVLPSTVGLCLSPGETLRFGRSRKDDFGLVRVVAVVDPVPPAPAPALRAGTVRVFCVSDVLLRDERLAPDPSPRALAWALTEALAPAAAFQASAGGGDPARDGVADAYEVVRRDGFGVAWGRPRPTQVALRAGSVITLTMEGTPDPGQLARVERDGIGERTAEGFGRIRFDPPELTCPRPEVSFDEAAASTSSGTAPATAATAEELPPDAPHPLELNAWRRAIRRSSAALEPDALVKGIGRLAGRRAQLGALRSQLERLSLPGGRDLVRDWLKGTQAVRARREAWTTDTLDDLAALLLDDDNQPVWKRLRLDGEQRHLVLAPGREDLLRRRLHTEALVVAVTDAIRHLIRDKDSSIRDQDSSRDKETRR